MVWTQGFMLARQAFYHLSHFDSVFCFETGTPYVAQAGLKLIIFPPHPLKYWDYKHIPPHLASKLLKISGRPKNVVQWQRVSWYV
jgi:hypothetical protein